MLSHPYIFLRMGNRHVGNSFKLLVQLFWINRDPEEKDSLKAKCKPKQILSTFGYNTFSPHDTIWPNLVLTNLFEMWLKNNALFYFQVSWLRHKDNTIELLTVGDSTYTGDPRINVSFQ